MLGAIGKSHEIVPTMGSIIWKAVGPEPAPTFVRLEQCKEPMDLFRRAGLGRSLLSQQEVVPSGMSDMAERVDDAPIVGTVA